ncbi:MAG: hypothetical protein ACYC5H_15950 [Methylovirgula sp.]
MVTKKIGRSGDGQSSVAEKGGALALERFLLDRMESSGREENAQNQ